MNIEKEVMKLLQKNAVQGYKPKQLAKLLKISTEEYPAFKRKLKKMVADGRIHRYKKGRLGAGKKNIEIVGKLHVKTQGYGFIITEDKMRDIFISQRNMGTALHGDSVKVELYARSEGKSQEGRVVEIVERARKNIVGTFQSGKHWSTVIPDDLKMLRDIYIAPGDKMKAKTGQKVVVHLKKWEDGHENPTGKVIEILGDPEAAGVDILSIARSFDLPAGFSQRVMNEAESIAVEIPAKEIEKRLDWRKELTFTVDPVDAKDFDDAVSLKLLENGNYLLGVHIADVSFFVRESSKIDSAARERGTSVYLVDRVIPMLPEKISNEICSLRPEEDRLVFSVLIEMTPSGDVKDYTIAEAVINSDRRFSYEEVQEIIDGKRNGDKFTESIHRMFELSKKLIQKRNARGSLDFGSHEVRFILDEQGKPVEIKKVEQLDSHRIVEEFMVLTNSIVARHIAATLKEELGYVLPFPYRTHERPDADKLNEFMKFTQALGLDFKPRKRVTPTMFQRLLQSIDKNDPRKNLIETVTVRTMMKAKYSSRNDGHFGLALKYYCHFTSPIRRYPDLIAHRLLKIYLQKPELPPVKKSELDKTCSKATDREVNALEAERASIKVKQLEFMEERVGETYKGVISGITSFGVFVEISEFLIEGMIHITNLRDDYYIYDEERYQLLGQKQGKIYQLGDPVIVRVMLVNLEERFIDFDMVESLRPER